MYRLLTVVLLVAGCGGAATSPVITTPAPTSIATATAAPVSATPVSTPSASLAAASIDPTMVTSFTAAVSRLKRDLPTSADLSDPNDWPAAQVLFRKQADVYDAFARDLEAIPFPKPGEGQGIGSNPAALIGWSKQLASVLRQVADAGSFEVAMQDTVEFEGATYQMQPFLQDASGEWGASLSLTAADLGVDLAQT